MRGRIFALAFFILFGLVSAVSVDFECPPEVAVDEEFSCSLAITDGEGLYDIKVEIRDGEKDVARIFDEAGGRWKSAYYYLNELVENGKDKKIRLQVGESGDYKGVLKLRQGDKRDFFDFEISVCNNKQINKIDKENTQEEISRPELQEEIQITEPQIQRQEEPISLNSKNKTVQTIYESKNFRVLKYIPYAFSLFLILLIVIILRD